MRCRTGFLTVNIWHPPSSPCLQAPRRACGREGPQYRLALAAVVTDHHRHSQAQTRHQGRIDPDGGRPRESISNQFGAHADRRDPVAFSHAGADARQFARLRISSSMPFLRPVPCLVVPLRCREALDVRGSRPVQFSRPCVEVSGRLHALGTVLAFRGVERLDLYGHVRGAGHQPWISWHPQELVS